MSSILSGSIAEHRDSRLRRNARTSVMIWRRDLIRLKRNYVRIVFGLAQPIGFLVVFAVGLARAIGVNSLPGHTSYRVFIFPGILAMSIISSALISSVSIVWDREFGFMREMLVAPVSRAALIAGKALGGGSIAMTQGVILLVLSPLVGVHLTAQRLVGLLFAMILMAFVISALGVALASSVDRLQTLQAVMALVVQPIIFTSGALFPIKDLPAWLAVVCRVNPATYGVDLARRVLLGQRFALTIGNGVGPIWFDLVVMALFGALMLTVATWRLGRIE
ncbi:MAG: type transport system permease protein [Actinomycetota bacterium]|nr:type transport system permease protein [Actinomycetota bacterium]